MIGSHLFQTAGAPHPHPKLLSFLMLGPSGVRVFFVISGFLITTLLLGELHKSGRISLPRFYFRRTLRIFPPYYVYIAFVAACSLAGLVETRPFDVLHAMTYTTNYHPDRAWVLGHAWSLSVEEQFYLLWPAVMAFAGRDRARRSTLAYVALAPLLRIVALKVIAPRFPFAIDEAFPTTADSLAMGCLLALMRGELMDRPLYRSLVSSRLTPAIVLAGILFAHALDRSASLSCLFGITLENACMALLVDWAVRNHDGALGRVLNARPVVLLGTWSYSLYLWQQPFINPHQQGWPFTFPVNLALAMICAIGSYYLIEKPSLRLRDSLEKRAALPRAAASR